MISAHTEKGKKMPRLIDANRIVYSWTIDNDGEEHDGVTLQSIIDKMPTVDAVPLEDYKSMERTVNKLTKAIAEAEPVRHGHWIDVNGDGSLWRCSVCGETQCCKSNYCGDCGAKMQEVKEDE